MTMAIVFGDRETAMTAARTVNQVHTRVRGDGYHALDPDLLLWVHATLVDTALVTYETFIQRLSPREREDFYQEMKLLGELLGVPRNHYPARLADFEAYMESMIAGPVKVDVITAGLLHPALREQFRLPWGRGQQRAFRVAVKTLPRIVAFTPAALRVWPLPGHNVTLKAATS
jgi:uncharacterized protein (DUF2236 family)